MAGAARLEAATADGSRMSVHELWLRRWVTRSNGVSYVVQRAAEALYTPEGKKQVDKLVGHYLANAATMRDGCEALGWQAYGGANAPYVWITCPEGLDSWQTFDHLLEQAHVVVVPGSGFGRCGEGFFRMSAFNTRENVVEAVDRLNELASR